MKVERGGKAIIAIFVGAWFISWAIAILAEVSIIAFAVGAPLFLILLAAWVFQVPRSGKALFATTVGLMFIVTAIVTLARVSVMAFVVALPLVFALLIAWVLQKPGNVQTDSKVPSDSLTG